jgi:hypothetical protein
MSSLLTMLSNRTIMAALFTIAIASSLIAVSSFAGSAFAKKGKGDSTANTMTNSGGSSKDNPTATSSDSQTPNTRDLSGTTDNSNTPTSDTGGVSAKDLKTFSTCISHDALDGRLNLGEVNDCYGQVFDQGFGHALDQSRSTQGNDLPSTG